jgi:two-component system, OmpR family, response regulator RegX3
MIRVLIVEDEEDFADPLAFLLRKEGFSPAVATTGSEALEEFDRNGADIVLLDLMLPGMSGTDVCKQLRLRSPVPVIMVTARDSEIDKVVGLELGADDYITKPFSPRELVARVKAVLRRFEQPLQPSTMKLDDIEIDTGAMLLTVRGKNVPATATEFRLLEYLARHAGRVFTRDQLLDAVWRDTAYVTPRSVDVYVRRIREKIERDPENPRYLRTVRGAGYRFEVPR